ncbi:hypothetical protein WH47_04274 [Habropoda laboriosa]|uniref:Uncharacterized protein n=1 Tax=Habropoda laboriosa TaxID=597456 RepID=A0A0L7QVF2_9HYME|nr:hypothetical protein WH47_04274 [Habropoda laboriosa]
MVMYGMGARGWRGTCQMVALAGVEAIPRGGVNDGGTSGTQSEKAGGVEEEGGSGGRVASSVDQHDRRDGGRAASVSYGAAASKISVPVGGGICQASTSGTSASGRSPGIRDWTDEKMEAINKRTSRNAARRGGHIAKGGAVAKQSTPPEAELHISSRDEEGSEKSLHGPPAKAYRSMSGDARNLSGSSDRKRGRPCTTGEYKDRNVEIESSPEEAKSKKKKKKKKTAATKPVEEETVATPKAAQTTQVNKTTPPEGQWSKVVGRKEQRTVRKAAAAPPQKQPPTQKEGQQKKEAAAPRQAHTVSLPVPAAWRRTLFLLAITISKKSLNQETIKS